MSSRASKRPSSKGGHVQNSVDSKRRKCGHCQKILSKRQFFEHKRRFYDCAKNSWTTDVEESAVENEGYAGASKNSEGYECPHCGQRLGKSQYYEHKRRFYDASKNIWKLQKQAVTRFIEDLPGSSSEDETCTLPLENNNASNYDRTLTPDQHMTAGSVAVSDDSSSEEEDESDEDKHDSDSNADEPPEHWDGLSEEDLRDIIDEENSDVTVNHVTEEQLSINNRQKSRTFPTWLLYFIFLWQYYNLISDRGIEGLLKYLSALLSKVGEGLPTNAGSELLISLAGLIPVTMYSLRRYLGIDRDNFQKCVVCGKCTKLFKEQDCVKKVNGKYQAKVCDNVLFPRSSRRKPCGGQLVKKVFLNNGSVKFYPIYTYCFKSVIDSLETLLKRPGFKEKCEEWRERNVNEDTYADVMDGDVWKTFLNYKGRDFLNLKHSYGLMLNCDWFQPFKRRSDYSIGVLYLALINLPRAERFKKENIILVGIIPALNKEPATLTHFLQPMVDELLALWKGVKVNAHGAPQGGIKIRTALLCCASDIPAARKLCGFLGHAAHKGCSHCLKTFPGGFGEKKDYSGFTDRDNWPKRTDEQHRRDALNTTRCKNKTARKRMEKELGTRYTELLRLPYYGSITMCVIDPMHNLFLGTAKHLFKLWSKNELFSRENINEIERRIQNINSTSDLGRLPNKITTNYGGFTASQWQNWILYYSLYCLEGILPEEHLNCLQTFVIACRLLCKTSISKTDLFLADRKLLDFAIKFENLYGKEAVTPNIHLHMHLKKCVENYGSVFRFWCFSFERYNGLLGNFHTNNRFIESQLMRKFICMSSAADLQYTLPKEYSEVFFPFCKALLRDVIVDNIQEEINQDRLSKFQIAIRGSIESLTDVWTDFSEVALPNSFVISSFDNDDLFNLKEMYRKLYPTVNIDHQRVNRAFRKYKSVTVFDERLGSKFNTRLDSSGKIMASWAGNGGIIEAASTGRPGFVLFYLCHTIVINGDQLTHILAAVQCYKKYYHITSYRNPLTVWEAKQFVEPGPATFIPVQRISSRFVYGEHRSENQDVIVVSPLIRHMFQ